MSTPPPGWPAFTFSRVLVLLAFVAFLLATFGVAPLGSGVHMVPLGLALWAASVLVP